MYKEKDCIKAISDSYKMYVEFGSRSTEKLKPIHKFVAHTLQNIFGEDYEIFFMSENTKK